MQGGSFLFPITPVFNSSLQCSHNQSISLIAQPQIYSHSLSLSLSPPQPAKYDRAPHTTPPPPSKHLNHNESNKDEDIQAHDLFDQSQINTMVSDHTDHRPRAGLTCKHLMYRYVCYASIYQQTTPRTRVRGIYSSRTNDASPRTVNLTRTNQDRSRAGESLKLRCLPKDTC